MQGTERAEARLSEAIAKARAAATQRARTEWVPTWEATAQHLRDASGAFMLLWTRYQECVIRQLPLPLRRRFSHRRPHPRRRLRAFSPIRPSRLHCPRCPRSFPVRPRS
jgi:hypothetical protein